MPSIVKYRDGWRAYLYVNGRRETRVFRTHREANSWAGRREEELRDETTGVRRLCPAAAKAIGAARLSMIPEASKMRMDGTKVAHVYLMEAGEHLKIGITNDPDDRWRKVRTGNPMLNIIQHLTPRTAYAAWIEQEAHRLLRDFRIAGEWFNCSLAVASEVVQELWRRAEMARAAESAAQVEAVAV